MSECSCESTHIYVTLSIVRDMNKTQIMSQHKIATIPVETFLYQHAQIPVDLKTFDQFTEDQLAARWDPDRSDQRHLDEKRSDNLYVWSPPKVRRASPAKDRTVKPLLNLTTTPLDALPIDVYQIRNEFFAIKGPEHGLRFFRQYGIFGREHLNYFALTVGLSFADLLRWQAILKDCRLTEPSGWEALTRQHERLRNVGDILDSPELSIPHESPIRIKLFCGCVRDAIMASIYLDNLANVKARMCQRSDCGVVYVPESNHKRKYCSPDCGHLVAVRNNRKHKADLEISAAKRATRKRNAVRRSR